MQHAIAARGRRVGLTAFLFFTAAFLVQEVYRTVTAVVAPALSAETGLSAADIGFVTSIYFLAFAAVQLPVGVLLDRFGPRRVVAAFLLLAAAGAALFAMGEGVAGLAAGRALAGLGMSCCLMAAFKANTLWWPPERLMLANSGVLTIGALGALAATAPVEALLGVTDWRTLFLGLAAVTVIVAAAIYSAVPERRATPADGPGADGSGVHGSGPLRPSRGLVLVLRSPVFWRIAPIATLTQAMWLAYQGLWAAPWLATVTALDRSAVILHLFCLALAVGVGFVLSSLIIDALRRRGWRPVTVIGLGMAGFLLIQLLLVLGVTAFSLAVWVAFGLFGSVSVAFYAVLSHAFPAELAGRVNSSLNLLVFVAAFAIQFGVGQVIDLWPVTADGGYPALAHRVAMAAVLLLQGLAFLWFIRPERARSI
ncbi:MFS transporter [Rhodospirillaceae bacterium SYSU D60014]|uniref:MFS transporter n=1 Tax=Virgifigura deserti TaxID=2268457 RepID=UPI0013C4EFAF